MFLSSCPGPCDALAWNHSYPRRGGGDAGGGQMQVGLIL